MPAVKNWDLASVEERRNYRDFLLDTWHTLNLAIEVLTVSLDNVMPLPDRLGIKADIRRLQKDRDVIDDYEDAFRYGRESIHPPSADIMNQAKKLTDQVQTLTNNSQAAGRALELARQALELLNKVRPA